MALNLALTSGLDGFAVPALSVPARGETRGGVLVVQEIFGVTPHIEQMCVRFADAGYHALAPGMYERVAPGLNVEASAEGIAAGRAAVMQTPWKQVVADMQAAIDMLPKPVFVTGFCWGGAAAWLAAQRCTGVRAASCFYGRMIVDLLDRPPMAPVMLHYGARDASIPPADIERVREAAPVDTPIYLYDAGHGFCRRASHDYDEAACELALTRTLDWFARWRAKGDGA